MTMTTPKTKITDDEITRLVDAITNPIKTNCRRWHRAGLENGHIYHAASSVLFATLTGLIFRATATAEQATGLFEESMTRIREVFEQQIAAMPTINDSGQSLYDVATTVVDDERYMTLLFPGARFAMRVRKDYFEKAKREVAALLPDELSPMRESCASTIREMESTLKEGDKAVYEKYHRNMMLWHAIGARLDAAGKN